MKKLIFTAMILGLSFNGHAAGKLGMTGTDCSKSVQSARSEGPKKIESKGSSAPAQEQKGKTVGR